MDEGVIDCCSLLNLYTGWCGLSEIRTLPWRWYVCDAVISEVEYTREYDSNGVPAPVLLNSNALVQSGLLLPARPESEQEIEDYVSFAMEVDDGEAQALSLAKNRRFVLLTDDRKAANVARRSDVGVQTISTAHVLRSWARLDVRNDARLREVVSRITVLAKYRPPPESADHAW